ncbi:protein phosphatase EYA-like [Tasmannia lanceolata]|uniref:protein phosphatase EYA-like n=1 Tax=Tasmannia lanceolata TaxID=3420 RepID=UPI004062C15F
MLSSSANELLASRRDGQMGDSSDDTPIICGQKTKLSAKDTADQKINVYIWDMDETLILLKSLLNGTYAVAFNGLKDLQKGIEIGKCWEKHILQVCDDFFLYEQIENYNEPFLGALSDYDDGRDLSNYDFNNDGFSAPYDDPNKRKLAYRHRLIAQKYAQGLHRVLDQEMVKLWDNLYNLTDSYTDRWLSSARNFLELVSGGSKDSTPHLVSPEGATGSSVMKCRNINVLVTSGSLVPSLVKCLLFRLDDLFVHGNVYSSWEVGKFQCFSWIKERFGSSSTQFCVIGDGLEECEAAEKMRWPYIRIDLRPDSSHRFPGLTMKTVQHYIDVVYGVPDAEDDNKQ